MTQVVLRRGRRLKLGLFLGRKNYDPVSGVGRIGQEAPPLLLRSPCVDLDPLDLGEYRHRFDLLHASSNKY